MALVFDQLVPEGTTVMSDEFHFNDEDDAKAEIRAAVRYLLKNAVGSDRGDIVRQIIDIVGEVARGLPPGEHSPLDDGMPGAVRRARQPSLQASPGGASSGT